MASAGVKEEAGWNPSISPAAGVAFDEPSPRAVPFIEGNSFRGQPEKRGRNTRVGGSNPPPATVRQKANVATPFGGGVLRKAGFVRE